MNLCDQKNRETAVYTRSSAMMVLTSLPCSENSFLNSDPKNAHRIVLKKPMEVRRIVKKNSVVLA